jgi:hypothetical protein
LNHQIEVADVAISNDNILFLMFAQSLVDLFADSQLKRLTLSKEVPRTILQTLENLQQGLCLLVERLPKLVHLRIRIRPCHRSNRNDFDCKQMESWFSTEGKSKLARPVHWRCTPFAIDLWL